MTITLNWVPLRWALIWITCPRLRWISDTITLVPLSHRLDTMVTTATQLHQPSPVHCRPVCLPISVMSVCPSWLVVRKKVVEWSHLHLIPFLRHKRVPAILFRNCWPFGLLLDCLPPLQVLYYFKHYFLIKSNVSFFLVINRKPFSVADCSASAPFPPRRSSSTNFNRRSCSIDSSFT